MVNHVNQMNNTHPWVARGYTCLFLIILIIGKGMLISVLFIQCA